LCCSCCVCVCDLLFFSTPPRPLSCSRPAGYVSPPHPHRAPFVYRKVRAFKYFKLLMFPTFHLVDSQEGPSTTGPQSALIVVQWSMVPPGCQQNKISNPPAVNTPHHCPLSYARPAGYASLPRRYSSISPPRYSASKRKWRAPCGVIPGGGSGCGRPCCRRIPEGGWCYSTGAGCRSAWRYSGGAPAEEA